MRRLKDTIVRDCTITLDRLVEHRKEGCMTTNEPVAYFVTIKKDDWKTHFRCNSKTELWQELQQHIHIWIEHPQTKPTRRREGR